ncbi:GAF domain-containing SpoIIE family protein phosphatase [Streptomyces microflavus]|uniref:PP2C family protein-serine/threonine phosphatase n=1 Tax=Streptomyces microflavus TaxID=1919 RepID=UPI002E351A7D|nr:GAF domain-containing SpoIIE family protein phosphatase [Streptomyces microflavus]WTF67170.1 SpoIIE family protein phosphatase [Streptomyces microflavus]
MGGGLDFVGGLRADGLPAALSDSVRLAAVASTGLLDTGPEEVFEDLASLAARVTGAGRAFVTLVDEERSFWKSCVGVKATDLAHRQNPVRESFCYFLVGLAGDAFIVGDAAADPRTREHPSVGPMNIGAWAGYPLMSPDKQVLGSFCVIDDTPRTWSQNDLMTLATLARSVSAEVHLRQSLSAAQKAQQVSADLAHSLQQGLLPPALRPVPGLDAAASYLPASASGHSGVEVGGDFYDLFHTTGDTYGAVLGDVCGKGVEAAKVTAMARYTVRADAGQSSTPALLLHRLNNAMLAQHSPRFLTAAYTTFRTTPVGVSGRIALAGHPPALIRRADGTVHQIGRHGTFLGALKQIHLTDVDYHLSPGDLLLLYSDGACEARPRPGTVGRDASCVFGEDELIAALTATHTLDATSTIGHLIDTLAAHHGGWASDDTALLALRVPPAT